MIKTTYEIILPISLSFFHSPAPISKLIELLKELVCASGKIQLPLWESKVATLHLDLAQKSVHFPKISKMNRESPFSTLFKSFFLKINTEILHEDNLIHYLAKEELDKCKMSKTEQIKLLQENFADILIKGIHDLIIASNIARPGVLCTQEGIISINNKKFKSVPEISNDIYIAIESTKHIGWPSIYELEFLFTWNWLQSVPSYWEGVGAQPIGRALSAFSYLFSSHPNDDPFYEILWSIVGLEALYGEDNTGIQKQIVQRTEALLGKRDTYKKIINEMYQFRSKFLHGTSAFPVRHTTFYGSKEYEKFRKDAFIPEKIAITVFIATLQEMVRQNLKELKFELSLIK